MKSSENIVVYRLGSLGDIIVSLPCFHLIREKFPQSKIILLTNQPVSGKAAPAMAILENSGLCDDVLSYPVGVRDMKELAALRENLRRLRPRALINIAAGRGLTKSLRDYAFFRCCGIKNIVGTPLCRRDLRVQSMPDGTFESEAQRLVSRLISLGEVNLAETCWWDLKLTNQEIEAAARLLPHDGDNFIAVSVGTKLLVKDWGEDNWEKLLAMLSRREPDATLILLGAPDEWERSHRLSAAWKGDHINLCGKTSPRVSAAVLQRCRLFVGHDSGPMHLAGAVGTPTLGLFSWQNPPGQWFPGHASWKFVKTLYPPLPNGEWKPELQNERGEFTGIPLLRPEVVLNSAVKLLGLRSAAVFPKKELAVKAR